MERRSVTRAHILVTGRVQGVGYRAFVQRAGTRAGLRGGVRNLDDGRVEVEVEGDRGIIEGFLLTLKAGPALARVDDLQIQWRSPTGQDADFRIWY